MVRKSLLELVLSSEFLEQIAVGLIGTEKFYGLVRDEIEKVLSSQRAEKVIKGVIADAVAEAMHNMVIGVGDNDILIVPSDGFTDMDFERLTRLLPRNKNIGVIAANDVKILRLS